MATTSDDGAARVADTSSKTINTTPAPAKIAGRRVAGIYELLEQIIAYLPPRDIILAKQVSRQFNDIIASSPLMPPKFLLSLHAGPFTSTDDFFGGHEVLPQAIDVWCISSLRDESTASASWDISCRINGRTVRNAAADSRQSWRTFLMCREVTRKVKCVVWPYWLDSPSEPRILECSKGITLGQLVDWAATTLDIDSGDIETVEYEVEVDAEGRSIRPAATVS